MPTFTMHAAKTHLSRLIERACAGEEIVIARGKDPVARLVPLKRPRRAFGALADRLTVPDGFFEPLPDAELEAWEGDAPPA